MTHGSSAPGRATPRSCWIVGAAALVALGAACSSGPPRPSDPVLAKGQDVYNANCATCHGTRGEGGSAPVLQGVEKSYPDINRQIALVTNGVRGSTMPAWGTRLSPDDITAVVRYTRESL